MTTTFVLDRDCGPKYEFDGELIAEASSQHESGSTGRWTELRLYRTVGGKYICERRALTCWENETDSHEAEVALTAEAVVLFFGYGKLAKQVYKQVKSLRERDADVDVLRIG